MTSARTRQPCSRRVRSRLKVVGSAAIGMTLCFLVLTSPGSARGSGPARSTVEVGTDSACALVAAGKVACWGFGGFGELGDGSRKSRSTPAPVRAITTAVGVFGGDQHECALLRNRSVKCWGFNFGGDVVPGVITGPDRCGAITSCSKVPTTVTGVTNVMSVAVGDSSTCALVRGGRVDCWGIPLDNGSTRATRRPTQVNGIDNVKAIAAGFATCGLLAKGVVDCWGGNLWGALGRGRDSGPSWCFPSRTPCALTPGPVRGITQATAVGVGDYHGCAVTATGGVKCWGLNNVGQLGQGTASGPDACRFGGDTEPCSTVAIPVRGVQDAKAIAVGANHACALLRGGSVECWGDNDAGQLGERGGPEVCGGFGPCSMTPVPVRGIGAAVDIAAGGDTTCVRLSGAGIRCWGDNTSGQARSTTRR